jgi:hypothetical protein
MTNMLLAVLILNVAHVADKLSMIIKILTEQD